VPPIAVHIEAYLVCHLTPRSATAIEITLKQFSDTVIDDIGELLSCC
jgi:hypothetical protein